MRFIVYGAGAVGGVVGGNLFRVGYDVVLVANPKHADKICESGLRLVTPVQTFVLNVPAYKKAEELAPFHKDDVILLTVKSQHTLLCLGQLKKAGAPRSLPVFCCQNSICNEPLTTRVFDKVYGAVIGIPAIFLKYGEVINPLIGSAGFVEVGLYPHGVDRLAYMVATALSKAGFLGGVNKEIMKAKAAKCLGNLGNAIEAITGGNGDSKQLKAETEREAEMVWQTAGIEWEDKDKFNRRMRSSRGEVKMPKGFGNYKSSSLQSLLRGTRNIEAEQLNGDIVKLGRMLGVATPYNELIWQVADEMARKGEKPGKYSIKKLMKMVRCT